MAVTCLMLAAMSAGCVYNIGDAPYVRPHMDLQVVSSTSRLDDRTYQWDVQLRFSRVRYVPEDEPVPWANLTWFLDSSSRRTEFRDIPTYPGVAPLGRNVSILYQDLGGVPWAPDDGDIVWITGLDRGHQGASLTAEAPGGRMAAHVWLPSKWNETLSAEIEAPNITLIRKGEQSWNVELRVQNLTPGWEQVPWQDVDLGILPARLFTNPDVNMNRSFPSIAGHSYRPVDPTKVTIASDDGFVSRGDSVALSRLGRDLELPDFAGGHAVLLMTGTVVLGYVCLPEALPDPTISIGFGPPDAHERLQGGERVWDASVEVVDVEPVDGSLPWSERSVVLWLTDYQSYGVRPLPADGTSATGLRVTYSESAPPLGEVSAGDVIRVEGMNESFSGASIQLRVPGDVYISFKIPALRTG